MNRPPLNAAGLLTRRTVLRGGVAACLSSVVPRSFATPAKLLEGRIPAASRHFISPAIEREIARVKALIADPMLGAMFEQCFPNTLDTTVFPGMLGGAPDTYVITGDIDAMWLRDSSAQVWPYLRFAKQDSGLATLLEGVVRRQARMVLLDPYANAFTRSGSGAPLEWAVQDKTTMRPGVAERKWEVDSLCYVVRLAHGYWRETGNARPFDDTWKAAARQILRTFREQQRLKDRGPYSFQRRAEAPTDSVPLGGYGNPARPTGMVFSMFRPSDDACIYPYLVPSNMFAIQALHHLREMATELFKDAALAAECDELAGPVAAGVEKYGTVEHPVLGKIWAYEVDGYGNTLMMDDANAPGLLSLPYLGLCDVRDPVYVRTRQFVLSGHNPYFFKGRAAEGVGGPHVGLGNIWPLSIIMRALTSTDDREISQCLKWLRDTTAGTGFMHESFQQDDPAVFTREWFAWANTLFGELILKLAETKPGVLRDRFS
jgi:meiotically up-regulated gene 157 (Mug157) protein